MCVALYADGIAIANFPFVATVRLEEDSMAETESAPPPVPVAAGIPIKMVIVIVAGKLVLGLGGAFAFFKFMGGGPGRGDQEAEATTAKVAGQGVKEPKHDTPKVATPGTIYDVEPFIVNLADTPEVRYLKLTVKLEL